MSEECGETAKLCGKSTSVRAHVQTNKTNTGGTTMKRLSTIAVGLLLVACTGLWHLPQASGQADAGWVTLFDGSSLDNWSPIGDANWKLADGVAVADKG